MSSQKISHASAPCQWYPPIFLKKGVHWLREHPNLAFTIAIISLGIAISMFTLKTVPFNQRLIIGGSCLGGILLISLPILFEWCRQRRVQTHSDQLQEAKRQKEAIEGLQAYSEYIEKNKGLIEQHNQLIENIFGGKENFHKLPELAQCKGDPNDLTIFEEEMTHSIMRGQLSKSVLDKEYYFNFVVIRFRPKNVHPEVQEFGKKAQRTYTMTLYQRLLYNGSTGEPEWVHVGYGDVLFNKNLDKRFNDPHLQSYYITKDPNAALRPTLIAIKELVEKNHAHFELA